MHCFRCESDCTTDMEMCEICGKPLDADPDRYFKAGMNALLAGEIDRSVRLLEDCVTLNPNHLSGRYNLGIALCLSGRCDEAMEHYTAVIELEPNYPGVYTMLGQAAFGDYLHHVEQTEAKQQAMFELLEKAVEQDPSDVDALYSLANAHMAVGSAEDALPWLQQTVELQPDSSAIYFAMGKAYRMLRRDSEATAMARLAMELSGSDDPLHEDIQVLVAECEQIPSI